MFVLIQYILVAATALPQGSCCIALGCDPCSKRVVEKANPTPDCCKCCVSKSHPTRKARDASGSKKCPGPKSCECRCRFPLGLLSSPLSMDAVARGYSVFDRTIELSGCLTQKNMSNDTAHSFVRLQVLYCIWRC